MTDEKPPSLFDLPLDEPAEPERDPRQEEDGERGGSEPTAGREAEARGSSEAAGLPLFPEMDEGAVPPASEAERAAAPAGRRSRATGESATPAVDAPDDPDDPGDPSARDGRGEASTVPAPLDRRLLAGLVDLGVHLLLVGLLAAGTWILGAPLGLASWTGFALFLAVFSFLYTVIPLAFWGYTPGMYRARLRARNEDGGALTFGQTALRWVGGVLTLAAAALPVLLSLVGGRSLTDRVSGSRTFLAPAGEEESGGPPGAP